MPTPNCGWYHCHHPHWWTDFHDPDTPVKCDGTILECEDCGSTDLRLMDDGSGWATFYRQLACEDCKGLVL